MVFEPGLGFIKRPAAPAVDPSDRKFYIKAAEVAGNDQALKKFDATLAAQRETAPSSPGSSPSGPPATASGSLVERQASIDSIVTASPYAAQTMQAELDADIEQKESRAEGLRRGIDALGTSGGYATEAMRAELNDLEAELAALRGETGDEQGVADGGLTTNNTGLPIDTSGQYANILANQGAGLDLDNVDEINDGQDNVIIQSIYDPVVSGKETIVDEYSVVVELPPGVSPQDLLRQMAGDLDGVIPEVREHGDFRNQTGEPGVGTISEIDINEGPLPLPDFIDESAINAPVVMTEYDPDSHFIFQTIEQNGNEHPLHGSREFGFEELEDGKVRIYTRAVAAPDIIGAEIAGLQPERDMWGTFISGVENYVADNGGQVHGRHIEQDWGPTGDEFWKLLPRERQVEIRDSQTAGLQREIDRLTAERDDLSTGPRDVIPRTELGDRIRGLEDELRAWEEKELTGQ